MRFSAIGCFIVSGQVLIVCSDTPGSGNHRRFKSGVLHNPQCFDELSKELQKLGISILVVVDDIDRLQADELLDLLKVVRLLGRFPGVDYLLAYDEQSLIEILRSPDGSGLSQARARSFMEKEDRAVPALPSPSAHGADHKDIDHPIE